MQATLEGLLRICRTLRREKAREIRAKGEGILAECESMGGDIYAAILKQTEE